MGHERVGTVPKTERWNAIIRKIDSLYTTDTPVSEVADQTLRNVRNRYATLALDPCVQGSFKFLVILSNACGSPDAKKSMESVGIKVPANATPLSVVKALKNFLPPHVVNTEYGQLAIGAAADAIGHWYRDHASRQDSLFKASPQFFEDCRALGDGRGFCELSRLYFGKLTERYLNYFLDRATLPRSTPWRRDSGSKRTFDSMPIPYLGTHSKPPKSRSLSPRDGLIKTRVTRSPRRRYSAVSCPMLLEK